MASISLAVSVFFILLMFQARDQIPKGRLRLLRQFLAHPQSLNRFPHRAVERLYRSVFLLPPRKLSRTLNRLPTGTNILTNGPKDADLTLPAPSDIFFEPAGVHEATEYMDLIRLGSDQAMRDGNTDEERSIISKSKHTAFSSWMKRIGGMIMSLIGIAWLIGCMIFDLYNKDYTITMLWIFWVAVGLGQYWMHIFYENQWWLIPGGIIGREYRLWKRRLNVRIVRAPQAVSFYDMHRKELHIAYDNQYIEISLDPTQYQAFLVGWFSTARSPSEEEIQSFLDAR